MNKMAQCASLIASYGSKIEVIILPEYRTIYTNILPTEGRCHEAT